MIVERLPVVEYDEFQNEIFEKNPALKEAKKDLLYEVISMYAIQNGGYYPFNAKEHYFETQEKYFNAIKALPVASDDIFYEFAFAMEAYNLFKEYNLYSDTVLIHTVWG